MFTQKVEQYMQASDLIITKPGGLTVTEALASNLPLLVFDSIPGQEEDNADFLELHGMARRLHKNESCTDALKELLEDKMQLASMEQACKNFDKSDGYAKIVSLMKDMIK
ncbi:MAG: glycosyltransferase [Acutalibacteraceae bacterium]